MKIETIKNIKLFIFSSLMMLTISAIAQNKEKDIEEVFDHYFLTLKQKQYTKIIDYIHPEVFKQFPNVPKETIIKSFSQIGGNGFFEVFVEGGHINTISEIVEVNRIKYAVLNFSTQMKLKSLDENSQDSFNPMEITYQVMLDQYGKDHVQYNQKDNELTIDFATEMYAIYNPNYKGWKFIGKKELLQDVINDIIPIEVREQLVIK